MYSFYPHGMCSNIVSRGAIPSRGQNSANMAWDYSICSYAGTRLQKFKEWRLANNAGRRHLRWASRGDLAVPATRTLRIRSSQLRRGRTVHLEFSSSTDTQLPTYILVLSWSENWTVYQSVSLARSWLFLAVRADEQNFSTHHHHQLRPIYSKTADCAGGSVVQSFNESQT